MSAPSSFRHADPGAALPANPSAPEAEPSLADCFRDPDALADSPLAWQLDRHGALVDALRLLFQGGGQAARLRLWMLFALAGQGQASLPREALDRLFHALRADAVDAGIKRLREAALLSWDDSSRHYGLTPLAQQLAAMLAPLTEPDDDELAGLLGQVVGADRLGTLQGSQVQMLQAQLVRLHQGFADAIASGSEFRLREARKRYDRASQLIDKASDTITAIIGNARGQRALEQAARGLGLAQSRLLAMASQFNRALQQMDRQRVTLGTTGITSTDVKRWLQGHAGLDTLAQAALHPAVGLAVLAPHDMLDVTETEFERDRPQAAQDLALPAAQAAPVGDLAAVALPPELGELSQLLARWAQDLPADRTASQEPAPRPVHAALLGEAGAPPARYAQVAYKTQLLPLLGDAQAQGLPGLTGDFARQPWRLAWHNVLVALDHPALSHLSGGELTPAGAAPPQP